jgi:autotransporter passenger strand-loop-strand repeat protein
VSGTETSATVSGGKEIVSRTGVASGTTVLGHGSQTDLGKTIATVLYVGTETVSSGGTASNTTVLSGGSLVVLSHGLADPATIYGGGSETISKGGTDLGADISGGTQIDSGLASGAVIFAGSQVVRSAGTAIGTAVSGGTEIVSSGGTTSNTLLASGQETVLRGGHASGTIITSGGYELVSSGGTAVASKISGGTLEVASGGSASSVVFSSGGMLQVDSGGHVTGTISGFHLGDEIDLRGLAYNSGSSTLSWKQKTSGTNASGTLTVKEGTHSMTLTLVGSYTSGNFTVTSDGHGGTLITDPPVPGGGTVITSAGTSSSMADIAPGSASVISGGYEFGASGGTAGDTDSGGGTASGVFFSGGGMMRLDSLLSQFAGVISGFDLWDELGPRSLGFGSSANAMSWMRENSGTDTGAAGVAKGGDIFNLTLLGQYGANFGPGADGHGGTLITDPPASNSEAQTPLVAHQ